LLLYCFFDCHDHAFGTLIIQQKHCLLCQHAGHQAGRLIGYWVLCLPAGSGCLPLADTGGKERNGQSVGPRDYYIAYKINALEVLILVHSNSWRFDVWA
jgi:hypothetical protein